MVCQHCVKKSRAPDVGIWRPASFLGANGPRKFRLGEVSDELAQRCVLPAATASIFATVELVRTRCSADCSPLSCRFRWRKIMDKKRSSEPPQGIQPRAIPKLTASFVRIPLAPPATQSHFV